MAEINRIVVDRKLFKTEEQFVKKIGELVNTLTELEYVVLVRYEDCGIYIVEFEPNKPGLGGYLPYWLLPEEYESITVRGAECET